MREMLEPVFGPNGAVVAQFVITLVVVLALVAIVVWLVRRYGGNRIGQAPRNRAPRLAILDTVPVDQRRRLVLIRRDNVEHLLLIGGPTDVVVEPAIRRAAQRQQGLAAAGTQRPAEAPAAAMPRHDMNGGSEPVPFHPQGEPLREMPEVEVPPPMPPPLPRRAAMPPPPAASAHFTETTRPTRVDSVFSLSNALDEIIEEPSHSAAAFEPPGRRLGGTDRAAIPPEGEEILPDYLSLPDETAPATAAEDIDERPGAGDTAAKVSDLEREMARLLGEITAKRGS